MIIDTYSYELYNSSAHSLDLTYTNLEKAREYATIMWKLIESKDWNNQWFIDTVHKAMNIQNSWSIDKMRIIKQINCIYTNTNFLLAIQIIGHCNISCKYCISASPIIQPWFADMQELLSTIKTYIKLCDVLPKKIYLYGGEPTLHPQFFDILYNIRLLLPNTELWFLTNGLIFQHYTDEQLNKLYQLKVGVSLSIYGPCTWFGKITIHTTKQQLKQCNKCPIHVPIIVKNYYTIDWPFMTLYSNGIFFFCNMTALAYILKFPHLQEGSDYIDINKLNNTQELLTFLQQSSCQFSSYCTNKNKLELWSMDNCSYSDYFSND